MQLTDAGDLVLYFFVSFLLCLAVGLWAVRRWLGKRIFY